LDELRHVEHPVLEQIAEAALAHESERMLGLDVLREHEHADAGMLLSDARRRAYPLGGEGRGHSDVRDNEVGLLPRDRVKQRVGVAHGGNHLMSCVLEKTRQSCPQEHLVFGYRDAQGNSAASVVPTPTVLSNRSV